MKELKIVFTKSKKKFAIGSWLIRWWTGQEYSHVAKEIIRQNWGAGYYQASEGKVNYEHESIFLQKHEIVKEFILLVDTKLDFSIKEACWRECGNDYGTMQNLGILLVDIAAKLGIRATNPWKKGRNCSELLYLTVLKQMYPELDYNPDTIKPHHIEEILTTKYKK